MYLLESGWGGAGSKGETQIGARRGGGVKVKLRSGRGGAGSKREIQLGASRDGEKFFSGRVEAGSKKFAPFRSLVTNRSAEVGFHKTKRKKEKSWRGWTNNFSTHCIYHIRSK